MKALKNKLIALWQSAIARRVIIGVIILVSVLLFELFISNIGMAFVDKDKCITDYEALDQNITLKNGKSTSYTLVFPSSEAYAIRISSSAKTDFQEPIKLEIKAYDEKRSQAIRTMVTTYISPNRDKLVLLDYTSPDNSNTIVISLSDITGDAQITSIVVNPSSTFRFNTLRFFIVLLIAMAIYLVKLFTLDKELFDFAKRKHRVTGIVTISICLLGVLLYCVLFVGIGKSYDYPLSSSLNYYDPYTQQFDAFLKGQLHIDYPVSEELLELENPYDYGQRQGISYMWDRAMYEGKYYSYFGIAPILNLYFPHYLLTGKIISAGAVKTIYALIATFFSCASLYAFVEIFKKKVSVSMLSLLSLTITICSGVMLMARSTAHFYYIAVISAMAYMSQFVFFMLLAIREKHKILRPVLFALAGANYAMLFLSRVNMALLCAFIVLPTLYFVMLKNDASLEKCHNVCVERTTKEKIIDLSALGSLVIVAVIFTMIYNNARFDSPFEFGAKYQLTVSDVSKNKIDFSSFTQMLYHSFIQPFKTSGSFPFFTLQLQNLNNYGGYLYVDAGMGLFAIPFMLAIFLGIPVFKSKEKAPFAKWLCAMLFVGVLVISIMNFYIGGVIYRYTCDITLLCALACAIFIISFNENICNSNGAKVILGAEKALIIVSIFISLNVLCSLHGYLANVSADSFVMVEELFR